MEKDRDKGKANLESMDRKNIHSTPDGYFDKLPYSIQQKIAAKKKPWFENLRLNPVKYKYALTGFCVLAFALFIYLIVPKDQQLISKKDSTEIKRDSLNRAIENKEQKDKVIPVPLSNNSMAIEQPKTRNNSQDKNKDTLPADEKPGSPESYLAEMSAEDIQEYLDINDEDDFQMEDILPDEQEDIK
jgi:hypothetical protein